MGVFENNKCLSINGGIIHLYSRLNKGISHDEEFKLIKKIAIIVRDYKITVSFKSIFNTDILATLNEAIKNNAVTKRTDKDGYVDIDDSKEIIIFKKNPRLFDRALNKAKGDKGLGLVEILKVIKSNYNNSEFIDVLHYYYGVYCNKHCKIKYSLDINNLTYFVSSLFGIDYNKSKKLIYAMKFNGSFDIMLTKYKDAFIYLGSVK